MSIIINYRYIKLNYGKYFFKERVVLLGIGDSEVK
jgi:hypothetical protein